MDEHGVSYADGVAVDTPYGLSYAVDVTVARLGLSCREAIASETAVMAAVLVLVIVVVIEAE